MISRLASRSDHRSMLPDNPVILEAVPRVAMEPWINLAIPRYEIFRRIASKSLYDSANLRIVDFLAYGELFCIIGHCCRLNGRLASGAIFRILYEQNR
jgi:hypothetical protein